MACRIASYTLPLSSTVLAAVDSLLFGIAKEFSVALATEVHIGTQGRHVVGKATVAKTLFDVCSFSHKPAARFRFLLPKNPAAMRAVGLPRREDALRGL